MKKENTYNSIEHLYDNSCLKYDHSIIDIKNKFIELNKKLKLNDYRIKIDTGFACNANCYFCYYKSHLKDPFLDIKEIKNQLVLAKKMNFKQVEFSGGESTYHPQWFEMLKIAQKLKFKSSLVTNGLLLANFDFIKKSKDLGLKEILFSVHGYQENHDKMIGVKRAFNKIIQAIKNAKRLNILVRANITVNLMNIKVIPKIVDYLLDLGIYQFNFIEINNSHEAFKTAKKQHKVIYESFKSLEPTFEKIINYYKRDDCLNIRYLPFCKIDKKFHKYMKNYIHHWFDHFDWNPLFVHRNDFNYEKIKAWNNRNILYFVKQLKCTRDYWYIKDNNCETCEFNGVCDGYKKMI